MKTNSNYFFCIPEKVMDQMTDIEALAADEISHFNGSYLKEILTLISLHQLKDEQQARLKSTYLNKLVPQYQDYLRFLINLGIIQRSGRYIPGERSYTYGYAEEYISKYTYFGIKDMFLISRLEKNRLNRHNSKKYPGQASYIRRMTIEEDALKYIVDWDVGKYNAALSSIIKIMQGKRGLFFSVDGTSGRFHSNLTNLPEPLRKFVRIEGKQLSNIDIKNSQPYLSTILLTDPKKAAPFAKSRDLSMLLQKLRPVDSKLITEFKLLAASGQIYEFLIEKGFAKDRKSAKKKLFTVMFGPAYYDGPQHEIFYRCFPEVYERFAIVKGHAIGGKKFTSYKRFAILLQTIESHLVLDIILPRIYKEHPGVIAVTIHDSVMTSTLTSDIQVVKNIMEEELTAFMGLKPTLKVENSDPNAGKQEEERGKEEKRNKGKRGTIMLVQTL